MDRILQFIEEHFICKFKEHTNQTVMAYICRRRLIKACDDIVSGLRLIDVAMKYSVQKMESEMGDFYFAYVVNYVTIIYIRLVGGVYIEIGRAHV